MTEDVIEIYDNINTKVYPYELLIGNFHDQPIPPDYYDFLNDDDDDHNNITSTPVENVFPDNKEMEYALLPNTPGAYAKDEDIDYETIIDDSDSLNTAIEPLQNEMMEIEGVDAENEGVENGDRVTVNANALPPEWNGYCLRNPPNINYNYERANRRSIGWSNLIVGAFFLNTWTP